MGVTANSKFRRKIISTQAKLNKHIIRSNKYVVNKCWL